MAVSDWQAFLSQTEQRMADLRSGIPGVIGGFQKLAGAASVPGALDPKTKELIALAIAVSCRCEGCLAYHSRSAAKYGATRAEVLEAIGVAIYMGGGPSTIYGAEALAAFDALSSTK